MRDNGRKKESASTATLLMNFLRKESREIGVSWRITGIKEGFCLSWEQPQHGYILLRMTLL